MLSQLSGFIGLHFKLTNDLKDFQKSSLPKLSYAAQTKGVYIEPVSLLFEKGLTDKEIKIYKSSNVYFFKTTSNILEFDLFAAIFYLISRYEEYTASQSAFDQYKRFKFEHALAHQHDFLRVPLIDLWITDFKTKLKTEFKTLRFSKKAYQFESTIDVDQPFAFKHQSNITTAFKSLLKGRFKQYKRYLETKEDPYNHLSFFTSLSKKFNTLPTYFLNTGSHFKIDPPPISYWALEDLFTALKGTARVQLHPSYHAFLDAQKLKEEKRILEDYTKVEASRQHFIALEFPDTYNALLGAGIIKDYSMGYPNTMGFRASCSNPFYWYDLSQEKTTELLVYPFWMMDIHVTKTKNKMLAIEKQAKETIALLKQINGYNCMVFHSHLFALDKDHDVQKHKDLIQQLFEQSHTHTQ